MNISIAAIGILFVIGCGDASDKPKSVELITREGQQDSLFNSLLKVTGSTLKYSMSNDSLAFMILPVQASCPSCRDKTIDSIIKHQNNLPASHFIIISASGGRKTMSAYFREQNSDIPDLPNQLILDSTNVAYKQNLFKDNPALYYSSNRKVYKKVLAIPATVKQDLQEFFTGFRSDSQKK